MSVTDFKRKSKRTYVLIGAGTALLPMLLICVYLGLRLGQYKQKNQALEKRLSERTNQCGYVLTQDLSAGQKLEEDMLKKIILSGKEDTIIHEVDIKQLAGKYVKCDFSEGTIMNTQYVVEEAEYSPDMRMQDFDFVEIGAMIHEGDIIDIRITFPNGEEYIVADHKTVFGMEGAGEQTQELETVKTKLSMKVTEEEMLRLASAYVDTQMFPGTRIYAVIYLDRFQPAATVNYPVNPQVFELLDWDPNVIDYVSSGEEQQYRQILEEHLSNQETAEQ